MSIIYITMIVALSAMGVGYAAWSDGLSMNVGITTGFIDPQIYLENSGNGGLDYELLNDNMTLYISGQVSQNIKDVVSIEIKDTGSIPTILNSVDELNTTDIVNLQEQNKSGYNRLYSMNKDQVENFELSINTKQINDDNTTEERSVYYIQAETDDIQSKIDKIQQEIHDIQDEIHRLSELKENHNFKYNLKFQQGL